MMQEKVKLRESDPVRDHENNKVRYYGLYVTCFVADLSLRSDNAALQFADDFSTMQVSFYLSN